MGLTFKENCPDIRNTKVLDLILEFKNLKVVLIFMIHGLLKKKQRVSIK